MGPAFFIDLMGSMLAKMFYPWLTHERWIKLLKML